MTGSPQAGLATPVDAAARLDGRETRAWLVLLAITTLWHLWALGTRIMSHDESIHAFLSLELLRKGTYVHDPAFHGPLLYHMNAVVFFLFGTSDFVARLVPALAGIALIAMLWPFRRYLGRGAALAAATLVALSPTLTFYGRQLWSDIYIALLALLWIYAAFRFLEDRRRRWLYGIAGVMGLAFITKEVSFILGASIGSFFLLLALVPARDDERLRRAAAFEMALLMLTLVLPFASGAGHVLFGWDYREAARAGPAAWRAGGLAAGLYVVAALSILLWGRVARRAGLETVLGFKPWLKLCALFWGLQIVFFTSFFANPLGGLTSGIAGSLGYWLTQHEVGRGSQPWFYYGLLALLYESLPLLLGGAILPWIVVRLRRTGWDPVSPSDLDERPASPGRSIRRIFAAFLVWWTVASWVAYALAGEKMPWLLTHMVLPLCLLGGWASCWLLEPLLDRRRAWGVWSAWGPAVLSAAALALAAGLTRGRPTEGRDLDAVARVLDGWLHWIVLLILLALLARACLRTGPRRVLRLAAVGCMGLLALFTMRTGLQLNFVNHDLAAEPISYAQGSLDVRRVVDAIERISARTAAGSETVVAYDDRVSWPMAWYLRDHPGARPWSGDPTPVLSAPVILVADASEAKAWPLLTRDYVRSDYMLLGWPLQGYLGLTPTGAWNWLADPGLRERLWQIVLYRRYDERTRSVWPLRKAFSMWVRSDLAGPAFGTGGGADAALATDSGAAVADLAWNPLHVVTGPFAGRPLAGPTAVTVAPDGRWVLADAGNHRVLVLDADGALLATLGSGPCYLTQPAATGCIDPDGAGPLATGDGQFNEPWGVAVDGQGALYVADTWNGRIQVFDGRGAFVRKWGTFGFGVESEDPPVSPTLYGPRGLVLDPAGHLVVSDTGNKRLLVFRPDGTFVLQLGRGKGEAGDFDEPVGVARDPNQTLLVADAWSQRIKRLDLAYRSLATWRVPGWASRAAGDKPFVAADADGIIYTSAPSLGRVLLFRADGTLVGALALPAGDGAPPRPTGVAVDDARRRLLVADHDGDRLLVYPLFNDVAPGAPGSPRSDD